MFFHALAAMLFAAVCAWCAHSLYTGLAGTALPVPTPQPAESPAPGTFRGVLLRREEAVSAAAFPEARAGFAAEAPQVRLEVVIGPDVHLEGTELSRLQEILSLDPRPAYQDCAGKVYGMLYKGRDIKFMVEGNTLTVLSAEKA